MTQLTLITPWDGHWRLAEYLSFVRWATGEEKILGQYRDATGDMFKISADANGLDQQIQSGEVSAWLQRFSDWVAPNVFGLPDDADQPAIIIGRTLH